MRSRRAPVAEGRRDDEPSTDRALSDFEARPLAPGVVLVTYRSTARSGTEPPTLSLRSSVWKLVDGSWRMIFHQGTPLRDHPDSPPRGGGESLRDAPFSF